MKRIILPISLILVSLAGYFVYRKRAVLQLLGKVPDRPPKVRLVYSKKQKQKDRAQITSSHHAVEIFREIWSKQIEVREEFFVLLMDKSNRVLGYQNVSKGGIAGTVVDMKLILSAALESLASAIIIAHNHPSGNLKPSQADLNVTEKLKRASAHMDIMLLDHIILTKESFYSMADEGDLTTM